MRHSNYTDDIDYYLPIVHEAFADYFNEIDELLKFYIKNIKEDHERNKFLYIASVYALYIKKGSYLIDESVIKYANHSIKFVIIVSLIESLLSNEKHITFDKWIKNRENFPITNLGDFNLLYTDYIKKHGSTKKFRKFISLLDENMKDILISKFKVGSKNKTIHQLAGILYKYRSDFIHNMQFALFISDRPIIMREKNKVITSKLSMEDLQLLFERGFLIYYGFEKSDLPKIKQIGQSSVLQHSKIKNR